MTKILRAITTDPFFAGFARTIDIFGVLARPAHVQDGGGMKADMAAIKKDWQVVGADLRTAMEMLDREEVESGAGAA